VPVLVVLLAGGNFFASLTMLAERRPWCSSSPVNPLPAWKDSSIVHRRPATATRVASGTGVGV